MKGKKGLVWLLAALTALFWLGACGGGSGDSGGGGGGGGVTPTHTISAADVDNILFGISDMVPGCSAPDAVPTSTAAIESLTVLAEEMADQIRGRYVSQAARGAAETINIDPVQGPCGGTLDINLTADDTTNAFSGSLAFSSFCIEIDGSQKTINGGAAFSGVVGLDEFDQLQSLTLNAGTTGSGISMAGPDLNAAITISGMSVYIWDNQGFNMALTLASASATVTQGEEEAQTVTLSNLALNATSAAGGGGSISLGATITTNEGTIVVSTPVTITINADGDITDGAINIAGAENTSVLITYAGSGYSFLVEADTTGDGSYDYFSSMDCSDLQNELIF